MSAPLLQVDAVTKRFAGLVAVDSISFSVEPGDAVAIIGPNGAGKTTLFNLISGQLAPTSGSVLFKGQVIDRLRPDMRARLGIGRTFQVTKPLSGMTTLENVMVAAFLKHPDHDEAWRRAYEILDEVDLARRASDQVSELTLSERRRLEVARALGLSPSLILLDEVMAGLNATEILEQIRLIKMLGSRGIALVLIEHHLGVVRSFSERVIVLDHGSMIANGSADDVLSDPAVIEAYLGKQDS